MFTSAGFDGLRKLPFTIPELVTASPCKSTDGALYSGEEKKERHFSTSNISYFQL
jgi:hypothetical protein